MDKKDVFKFDYCYFRYLGIKLGFSDEGLSRPKFDDYIENIIGHTTDNFVDYKLLNDNNLIVGADIAVFRIGSTLTCYAPAPKWF